MIEIEMVKIEPIDAWEQIVEQVEVSQKVE